MSYRLRRKEAIGSGVRRIARGRLDKAIAELRAPADPERAIHEVRKRLKELRAVLRLVERGRKKRLVRENRHYRDLARRLSGRRDARAVIESWDILISRYPDEIEAPIAAHTRDGLQQRLDAIAVEQGTSDPDRTSLTLELAEARERIASWPLKQADFHVLRSGLQTY